MDNDLEWLFEKKYEIEKNNPRDEIRFLSDWDSDIDNSEPFQALISKVYSKASTYSGKYLFSYEQFETKNLILSRLNPKLNKPLTEEQITLTPGATVSSYLAIKALRYLGVKRTLLFTPYYFSMLKTLNSESMEIIYNHLDHNNDFKIEVSVVKELIETQKIQALIITDPIYCVGNELSLEVYSELVELCNQFNVYLVIDYSIGGQLWNSNENLLFNSSKMDIWNGCNKFVVIDSPTKRLMLNGLKFSVVYGSIEVIDKIDRAAESVYGAFNAPQLELIKEFFDSNNLETLKKQYNLKISHLKESHKLLSTTVQDSSFGICQTSSGFLTVVYDKKRSLQELDTKEFTLKLMEEKRIIALALDCFGFYKKNKYGWRINLSKNPGDLTSILNECIGFYDQLPHN